MKAALLLLALGAAEGPVVAAPANDPPMSTMPRMGQAALDASIPSYPNATEEPTPVGETLEAKGVPMNVKSFMTNDRPRKVLDFYEAYFRKTGLPMVGNGDMVMKFPYPSVTVMDDQSDIDLSVICIPSADHRTMVLLARADMRPLTQNLDRAEQQRYGGLTPYPGGEQPSAVRFTDGEVERTQVTFQTSDAPDKVLAFYRQELTTQGAQVTADATTGEIQARLPEAIWRIAASFSVPMRGTLVTAVRTGHAPAPQGSDQ